MVFPRIFACIAVSLAFWQVASAQVVTGFGSLEVNPINTSTDFLSPWTGSQTSTSVSVSNVSAQSGGIVQDLSSSSVALAEPIVFMSLTGSVQALPASATNFNIVLYDSSFNALTAHFNWSSFSAGTSTVFASIDADPSFNGTVSSWKLNLEGAPADTLSFTFDELAVVPEPGAVTLFASAGFVLLAWRARRRN